MKSLATCSAVALASMMAVGCGSPDATPVANPDAGPDFGSTIVMEAPVLLDDTAGPCVDAHTVCLTVKMPDSIPGAPTHLAVGYYKMVPVKTPALARGVLATPPLVAGQQFRLMIKDGNLTGNLYPVVLVYMPGGGDIIAVDNLDYTAEATQTYAFTGDPLNVPEVLNLIYGL